MYGVGVIIDIVRSRQLPDREAAQRAVREAFAAANEVVAPVENIWATVGDEFQIIYANLSQAVRATALVRLQLPADLECRFGLGMGEMRTVESSNEGGGIQDGTAWYNARQAIEEAHRHEDRGHPYVRTSFMGPDRDMTALANAYLLGRDHTISRMKPRERRLAAAWFSGRSQTEIARVEGISQPAVSQGLQRCGATAISLGMDLMARASSSSSSIG